MHDNASDIIACQPKIIPGVFCTKCIAQEPYIHCHTGCHQGLLILLKHCDVAVSELLDVGKFHSGMLLTVKHCKVAHPETLQCRNWWKRAR